MKKSKFPSAQTILVLIAAIVALLTYLIPAGSYDKLVILQQTIPLQGVPLAE